MSNPLRRRLEVHGGGALAAVLLSAALVTPSLGAGLVLAEFPREERGGDYLSVPSGTIRAGSELPVRFRGLPEPHKHFLVAFIAERGTWRDAVRVEIPGESDGLRSLPLDWAGEYLVCLGLGPEMSMYGRTPQAFDECLRVFAIWGDPSQQPQPALEPSPPTPRAGETFVVRYEGMPDAEYAKIEIARPGTPVNVAATVIHATRGADSGEFQATLRDPGRYEIRVYYEALGRQVRAIMPLTVEP